MASIMVISFKFRNKVFINLIELYLDLKFHVLMVPFLDKRMERVLILKEDGEVILHPLSKVYVQGSRRNFLKGDKEFFSTSFKYNNCFLDNEDASLLLSYSTSSSFLPLTQQSVAVGASIEVPLGSVSGSGVAGPWVGFASHSRILLDTTIAVGYQHSTMVALTTEE